MMSVISITRKKISLMKDTNYFRPHWVPMEN